jgi:hypothetical protein
VEQPDAGQGQQRGQSEAGQSPLTVRFGWTDPNRIAANATSVNEVALLPLNVGFMIAWVVVIHLKPPMKPVC